MINPGEYKPRQLTSKILAPGNQIVRCLNVELKVPTNSPQAYQMSFLLEGPEIEDPDFVGLAVNYNQPQGDTYAGQVARVDAQQYFFEDRLNAKTGTQYYRDADMLRFCQDMASALGFLEQVQALPPVETIEEFIEDFKGLLCREDFYFWATLSAREYGSADNVKTSYRFAKYKNKKTGYAAMDPMDSNRIPDNLVVYNEAEHYQVLDATKAVSAGASAPVNGFGNQNSASVPPPPPIANGGFGGSYAQTAPPAPAQQGFYQQPAQQAPSPQADELMADIAARQPGQPSATRQPQPIPTIPPVQRPQTPQQANGYPPEWDQTETDRFNEDPFADSMPVVQPVRSRPVVQQQYAQEPQNPVTVQGRPLLD